MPTSDWSTNCRSASKTSASNASESPSEHWPRWSGGVANEVQDYLTHLAKERDVSPNTVTAYTRDLAAFVEFLQRYYGEKGWSWQGVDRIAMRGFLGVLAKRGLGKRSMARTLSAVRSFYKYLHQ